MIYYTKYAENKFEILNKYKVFLRKEEINEVLDNPNKCGKIGRYLTASSENIKVVYKKEGEVIKIITFYPVK